MTKTSMKIKTKLEKSTNDKRVLEYMKFPRITLTTTNKCKKQLHILKTTRYLDLY